MTAKKDIEATKKKAIDTSGGEPTHQDVRFVPDVDIMEDENAITLVADLPGVKPENVDVDVREGVLTMTAKVEPLPDNWRPVYTEYGIGGYQRSFTLGEKIDVGKITAKMKNGVLTLTLPKLEQHRTRKIQVQT
ncbi:MAG: Hsp20/alpha crystallin family protein [Deltaproteobacteria bacterium]|nr:MAG: Hsp20/alpha crystallin family protein [Deltaproteobacteria bacterium]